jgi:hypothetical protein
LEHLLECCLFHVYFPGLSNPMVAASIASPTDLDAKQIIMFCWVINAWRTETSYALSSDQISFAQPSLGHA